MESKKSSKYKKLAKIATAALIICSVISIYVVSVSRKPTKLELYVFNTPGNPSVFIRTPEDRRVLINGGSNSSIIRYLTDILPFYSKRIDQVVALSTSTDDMNGLVSVKERYTIGSTTPLKIDFLSQGIARFMYGNTSFMLLWHASKTIQNQLVKASLSTSTLLNLSSDVLIMDESPLAAHISSRFIEAVKPEYLIYSQRVSASNNKSEVHKAESDPFYMILKDRRFNVQQKSTVKVLSDGESVEII
jgi:hypothetical protein